MAGLGCLIALTLHAGGPMGIDGGVVVSGSTINLTPAAAANYVAGKTGWIRVNMILPAGHTTWDSTALGYYDQAINNARAAGLQVLILMNAQGYTGTVSNQPWNTNNFENTGGNGDNPYIDSWVNTVVVPVAQHFHDRVKVYEIWNEPSTWANSNSPTSFSGGTWVYPSCYSWMLAKSWLALHQTLDYRDVTMISSDCGQHFNVGLPVTNNYDAYLRSLYTLGTNPAVGSFSSVYATYGTYPMDGLGQHLYLDYNGQITTAQFQSFLNGLRQAFTNYEGAATGKKTFLTEFGWNTTYVSQQVQANDLAAAFNAIESPNSFVQMAIWFTWQDGGAGNFGVLDATGHPKIAYTNYVFYEQYEGYYTNGAVETNILDYFNAPGQAAYGDAFDNGASAFVHGAAGLGYLVQAQDFAGGTHTNLTIFDTASASVTPWYMYPISVPFADTNYDTAYGGSHDLDVQTPAGTPITSIVSGTVSSVDNPAWGWEIGIQLDTPINNAPYYAYLHLGAVKPGLATGQRVTVGELIAYSGGANSLAQLNGNTNTPFGPQFINDPSQSSQPQTGMALMRGPEYGVGAGWTPLPDPTLNPGIALTNAQTRYVSGQGTFEVNDRHGLWTYYNAHGGMGGLGPPQGNEYVTLTGARQDFANGSLVWNSAAGTVASLSSWGNSLVATESATKITATAATLNGLVLVGGTNTANGWFEWGTNANYGRQTAATSVGGGIQMAPVSASIGGLAFGMVYHYRLDVSNSVGLVAGGDRTFSTGSHVKAWGDDSFGQTNVPAALTNATAIASGSYHCLALQNNGSVTGWGINTFGEATIPATLTNAAGLAAGLTHSIAVKTDGSVAAWGGNSFGQTSTPAGVTNVLAVAAGAYHNVALQRDGTVVAWGLNNNGQTNVPAGLANCVAVAAGQYHSVALLANGTVMAWGANTYGQTNVPPDLTNATAIAAGQYHNLALRSDGTVTAWGRNNLGQTNPPGGLANVAAIACGGNYCLALRTDGTLLAWGDNGDGQTNFPGGLVGVAQLAGGMSFGLILGNQWPKAGNLTASGYVNHDLVIGLNGRVDYGDLLSYDILTLPAAGTLYQAAAGGRGGAIIAPNTGVADAGGNVVYAAPANQTGAPFDTFSYAVSDGLNESTPAVVRVNIGLPAMPAVINPAWRVGAGAGTFALTFAGISNATYGVWASTNLADWLFVGDTTEFAPGQYEFLDTAAATGTAGFYRLRTP